jgi:large subunit ribosomal protein L35
VPKIKTHKATAKRFKVTSSGKLLRLKLGRSHLRRKKRKETRRLFDKTLPLETAGEIKRVKRLVPYLKKR